MLLASPGTAVIMPFGEIELQQTGVDRTDNKNNGDSWSPATSDNLLCYCAGQDERLKACYGTTCRFPGPVEDGTETACDMAD
jgi:hypothetical protein